MTQAEAVCRAGVSRPSLSRWENDHETPNISSVSQLATLYGVSIDWLVGRTAFRQVFSPGMVAVDEQALEELQQAEVEAVQSWAHAWQLPERVTLLHREAAAAVHRRIECLVRKQNTDDPRGDAGLAGDPDDGTGAG